MEKQFNKAELKRLELALFYAYRDRMMKSNYVGDSAWKQAQEFEALRKKVLEMLKK